MTYSLVYTNNYGDSVEFSATSGFLISSKSGFSENNTNIVYSQSVNQVGSIIQGNSVQSKDLIIDGVIMGMDKKKQLLDTILPGVAGRLIYDGQWYLDVIPRQTPAIEAYHTYPRFVFTLAAAYPYWQSTIQNINRIAGVTPLFSFPWDVSKPVRFSERTGSLFASIHNSGNVEIPFTVVFYANASVTNPAIINVTTREFIRINREMESGEVITIENTADRISITSEKAGETSDAFAYLDIDSTFFLLSKGDNVIRYDADENLNNLEVVIISRDTVAGVY